jgi:protein SCO1
MRSRQCHHHASGPLLTAAGCTLLAIGALAHAGARPASGQGASVRAGASAAAPSADAIRRNLVEVAIPELKMVRQDGAQVSLDKELNDGRPVVLSFVYTSCTTICPISSQEFSLLQERLGKDRERVHLVSISIDPEQDTPARLREYARHFRAGKEWDYYTGDAAASVKAQLAFGVYRGDKMGHIPVTLLRTAPGNQWVRLDGFATAEQMYAELQGLLARR